MSILVGHETRLVVQGITGREGHFHTMQMIHDGTKIVAGVTPGKGGSFHEGIPVFDSVHDAVRDADANASIIFVPRQYAADAILEAADAGVTLIVCITEGIPALDMMRVKRVISQQNVRLIGPNCPGLISPGKSKVGIMPGYIHQPGRVGIISRSGTLTYEITAQLTGLGLGQSTGIGIGGDAIPGMNFIDCLALFQADPETDAVVMIGEIGGTAEERAAEFIQQNVSKPVVAFIAGQTAPPGRRMGHAGAIIAGGKGTAAEKIATLRSAGVHVADNPSSIAAILKQLL